METSLVGKPFLIRKFKYLRAAANLIRDLGRGGAERSESPPFTGRGVYGGGRGLGWYAHGGGCRRGRGIFALRRLSPYSRQGGEDVAG